MKHQVIFGLVGLAAGLVSALCGNVWPMFLTFGVGPVFAMALFIAVIITRLSHRLVGGMTRYFAAFAVCCAAYILAVFTLVGVSRYAGQELHFPRSNDMLDMRPDMLLGFAATAILAAVGVELVAFIFTGNWSNGFLATLMAAGVGSVCVMFVVDLPFHHYWSVIGILLVLGQGSISWVFGTQLLTNESLSRSKTTLLRIG